MIRNDGSGYRVVSGEGKNLSRVLETYKQAKDRLRQVERFKNKK